MIIKIIYNFKSFLKIHFWKGFQLKVFENRRTFTKKTCFAYNHADERKANYSLRDLFSTNQGNGS